VKLLKFGKNFRQIRFWRRHCFSFVTATSSVSAGHESWVLPGFPAGVGRDAETATRNMHRHGQKHPVCAAGKDDGSVLARLHPAGSRKGPALEKGAL